MRADLKLSRRALLRAAGAGAVAAAAAAIPLPAARASRAGAARVEVPAPPVTWRDPFGPRFVVVLDPGHGGNDSGTRAANGLLEKDLALDVARRLQRRLAAFDGMEVSLTREHDVWLSRADRVARVRALDADLLLSLHFNDLPERDVALVETWYAHASNIIDSRARRRAERGRRANASPAGVDEPNDVSFTRGSARFAALLQRHVFAAVAHDNARAVDAGIKRDTLFMLTRSFTSGALIELTCLSDATEAERLVGEPYRERLAGALAEAILDYRALSNVVVPMESVRFDR